MMYVMLPQLPVFGIEKRLTPFTDVLQTDWAYPVIESIRQDGIMVGDPDGRFRPQDPLSRREAAALMAKLVRLMRSGTLPLTPGQISRAELNTLEARLNLMEQKLSRFNQTA
jgi:hypothetical protein